MQETRFVCDDDDVYIINADVGTTADWMSQPRRRPLVIGFVSERASLKTCRITHTHMLSILMSDRCDLSAE